MCENKKGRMTIRPFFLCSIYNIYIIVAIFF